MRANVAFFCFTFSKDVVVAYTDQLNEMSGQFRPVVPIFIHLQNFKMTFNSFMLSLRDILFRATLEHSNMFVKPALAKRKAVGYASVTSCS